MIEIDAKEIKPRHFQWSLDDRVATITLNRPERKNPLTFEMYDELRDTFRRLRFVRDVRAVVLTGAGENFSSGGDVHEIIGPLVKFKEQGRADEILAFTRMTGDLVKTMRACPQPIVAAVDGVCAGAGAILAMASDLRFGTARSKVAFLFVRVGLAGADMGACAMLPRIIGHGRASELLFTGRFMDGEEAERWGFYNKLAEPGALARRSRRDGAHARRRTHLCPRHDEARIAPGVEHGPRRSHRRRGADAGDLHADGGLRARLPRVRREEDTPIRRQLTLHDHDHLAWPFFDDAHRVLARELWAWSGREMADHAGEHADTDAACRRIVARLGEAGWLRYCVPASHGGAFETLDVRTLCLCRETLAQFAPLADFVFAMQGLGAGPISLYGSAAQKDRYLPGVRDGTRIAAFAHVRAGRRVRRDRHAHRRAAGRGGTRLAARRREDLHLERGDRGSLRDLRARAGPRRQGVRRVRRGRRQSGSHGHRRASRPWRRTRWARCS